MKSGTISQSAWGKLSRLWTSRRRKQLRDRKNFRFESLEARLAMALTPADHIHPNLSILLDGQKVTIPANIGINTTTTANPHTHDTSGDLHIGEGGTAGISGQTRLVTLDDFFDVWRTVGNGASQNTNAAFDSTHILDRTADATHVVRMYVNGVPNTQFDSYVPQDRDQIVISYESAKAAGTPTLAPIENLTVLNGSPLYIPLNGVDPENQNLTYTVNSSNPSVVTTELSTSNPSLRINVENYGEMIFQLFQDKAPIPVQRVITLANQGFYNGIVFHRILNNFVIQGGDPLGTGSGGSTLGNFDDQFNVDLQHNRTGLLSFAKTTDDTNNSQFFITEGTERFLDFNHSIFGLLTKGENVRDQISNAPVTAAVDSNGNSLGVPVTPPKMTSVSVFQDTQNGALMLKAAPGAVAGSTSDITVTVTDPEGKSFQRTFRVTVQPDTSNGGPFLNAIPAIKIPANKQSTFQLPATDVEGDPITYEIQKQGAQTNYTMSVNPSTGLVTITPPTDFVGTLQVLASVRPTTSSNTNDVRDSQLLNITVEPSATLTLDLDTTSDTGASTTDNVTNVTSFKINVGGVKSGDVVRLFEGTHQIAEQTASGTTVQFTINDVTEGVNTLSAKLVVGGVEGSASAPLLVTVDRTAPAAFTSTATPIATATETYTYDVNSPDESLQTIQYSLANAPTGMTIDALTGVVSWVPTAAQTGTATFTVNATDAAGNVRSQDNSITVNPFVEAIAVVTLEIVDADGNVLTSVGPNGDFFLRASVQDKRTNAAGVFSVYIDITYDAAKATVTGPLKFGSFYSSASGIGTTSVPGIINEAGSISTFVLEPPPNPGEKKEIFRVPMRATGNGLITFQADPSDVTANKTLVFDRPSPPLSTLEMRFGATTLTVDPSFTAVNDLFSVPEDSTNFSLNVLGNETFRPGANTALTIIAVGASANSTATISTDGKSILYSPKANFVGSDTFSYTARNSNGETSTATVTVNVTQTNDNPVANNDTKTVTEDTTTDIDVLANDTAGNDVGETLRVSGVGATSNGGTVSVAPGNAGVRYTPAKDFVGTETFTYTLSDNNGGTATGTVTVTVTGVNDNPTAVADSLSILEDSSDVTINVLQNDSSAPDGGETLTITSVGTPTRGGTVRISDDKKTLIYTPAKDFQGEENIAYTISDGNGGTATSAVSVNVSNTNDPPTVGADAVTGYKNSIDLAFGNLLDNDSSAPDPAENLVISAVSAGSQGGTLKVGGDGKSVLYTPARDFVGTETFTYTVRDPGGLTTVGTVTVTVLNFIPSSLSGSVYVDSNKNGVLDSGERPLSNVAVKLTGTDDGGQAVNTTLRTNSDGSYTFTNLAPGNYVLAEMQPDFMEDGGDQAGTQGFKSSANDSFTIRLEQNTNGTGNNFGELGMPISTLTVNDLFARRPRNFITAAVNSNTDKSFNQASGGWQQYKTTDLSLSTDGQSVNIKATDAAAVNYTGSVSLSDTTRVLQLGESNGTKLVRLLGAPSAFNLTSSGGPTTTNQAPKLTATSNSIAYTENATLTIDDGILATDADSANLTGATVAITTNFTAAEDILEFTNQAGITGSYSNSTGVLTLTGSAGVAAYQTALRSVRYRNTSDAPNVSGRTISYTVNDGSATNGQSAAVTRLVTINTVNDAPVGTIESGLAAFSTGSGGVVVSPNFTVSDIDSTVMTGATISISGGFQSGQDALVYTDQNGITGNYNSTSGVLTLTGNSSLANYQTAIRSVKYNNTNSAPNTTQRTISFVVNDGSPASGQSAAVTRGVSVNNTANAAPVVTTSAGSVLYAENAVDLPIDAGLTLTDDAGTASGAIVRVSINAHPDQDRLIFVNQNGISGAFDEATSILTLSGVATIANYQTALRSIAYRNTSENPHDEPRTISFTVNDGSATNNLSNAGNKVVNVDPINDAPVVTVTTTTLNYAENAGEIVVDDAVTLTDVDNVLITGATISISAGFAGAEERLVFTDQNGIAGTYNALTGSLALSGSASVADYQTALRSIRYTNTSDSPTVGNRTISFVVGDGATENNSSVVKSRTLSVTAVNDIPLVNTTAGALSYTEGAGAVVVDPNIAIVDAEANSLTSATVRISTGYLNGQDELQYTTVHGITGVFDANTGSMNLTGVGTAVQYQDALRAVKFVNASNAPSTAPRTITFQVTDDGTPAGTSAAAARIINVSAINDAPVNTIPVAATVVTGNDLLFNAANNRLISIADADSADGDMEITLTALHGTIDLGLTSGLTFTAGDGTGDATMTLRGSAVAINAALANLTFHPEAAFTGAAGLTLSTSDLGRSGTGGTLTDSDTAQISVTAAGSGEGESNDAFFASLVDDQAPPADNNAGDFSPGAADELFALLAN